MITYEKVLVLKNIVLFEKASELALSDLIQAATEKTLKVGDVLLKENQENDALYIVLSGVLELMTPEKENQFIMSRQMLGETTVFSPARLGKVVAKEKTVLLKLTADKLYGLMALHPSLAYAFLGTLSHQLRMAQKNEQST